MLHFLLSLVLLYLAPERTRSKPSCCSACFQPTAFHFCCTNWIGERLLGKFTHKQWFGDIFSHLHFPPPPPPSISSPHQLCIRSMVCIYLVYSQETVQLSPVQKKRHSTAEADGERGESWAVTLSKSLQLHRIKSNMKLYPKFHSNCLPPPAAKTNKKQLAYDMQLPFPVSDTQKREKESMFRHFVGPKLQWNFLRTEQNVP